MNNVNLSDGVLTATSGKRRTGGPGYAAWNINGTITSTGNSLISTSDPVYGTVMLANGGPIVGHDDDEHHQRHAHRLPRPLRAGQRRQQHFSGLFLTGNGTLLLSGTNTYTGGTTVSSGTLVAAVPRQSPMGPTFPSAAN